MLQKLCYIELQTPFLEFKFVVKMINYCENDCLLVAATYLTTVYLYSILRAPITLHFASQFTSVQAACEQHVLSSLSCDCCLEVYFITSTLGILSLASAALTVATWNFENLAMTQQFQQLTLSGLYNYFCVYSFEF